MKQNTLKAAFWDYPELANKEKLLSLVNQSKAGDVSDWVLTRFLEYARVVDALEFFDIKDIELRISHLKLRISTLNKWKRLIEVYARG